MTQSKTAALESLVVEAEGPDPITVVCMHGYGADMHDLAGLASGLKISRPVRWCFPNAPLELEFGGRAWFAINVLEFEAAQREGRARDLSRGEPDGMSSAREAVARYFAELAAPANRVVAMGFSQGSMMAVDYALHASENLRGVGILSGTLVSSETVKRLAPKKKGQKFFQSHGSVDPILGFAQALALEKELVHAGWNGKLLRFEGGHGVPGEVAQALEEWVDAL